MLSGEQLYDSLTPVIGSFGPKDGPRAKNRRKGGPAGPRDQFALFFLGDGQRRRRPTTRPASRRRCG